MSTTDPAVSFSRLRRPSQEMLALLESYDLEAFGATGLRTYDLAVMAEAGAVYVAWSDSEIVAGCQIMRMMDEPEYCYVVGFYVRPTWQGKGVGRWFLQAVAAECEAAGAKGLVLTVAPGNVRALALYRRAGFAEEDFVPHFYGEGEDRYVLRWRFAEGGLPGSV